MRKSDLLEKIKIELEQHPEITSFELAAKCRIPLHIVEIFRAKITKTDPAS